MKRWIHSASYSDLSMRARNARRSLADFDRDKVEFVKECYDTVTDLISAHYINEDYDEDKPLGPSITNVKTDYLLEAIEDNLMTEEEFNKIYELLEDEGVEQASAWS